MGSYAYSPVILDLNFIHKKNTTIHQTNEPIL